MIKKTLFSTCFLIISLQATACDICGCGPAGQFFGMLPIFEGRYASLRYQQQWFTHPETPLNTLDGEALRHDVMQSMEWWMRWQLDERWQLIAQLPYRHHARIGSQGTAVEISGPGDFQITAFYKLWESRDSSRWQQAMTGGAQLVVPTGPYQQRDAKRRMLPEEFQLGTGAWGMQWQFFYTISRNGKGVQLESRWRAHLANELGYQRGPAWGNSIQLFVNRQGKRFRWMHYAGATADQVWSDNSFGERQFSTGGSSWGLSAGTDLYTSKSALHFLFQLPVYQVLTSGQPVNRYRLMLGYSRNF